MTKLYQNVEKLMAERNIKSILQLEKMSGITIGTIKNWKNRLPRCEPLMDLANFFEVSTDYLLGLEDEKLSRKLELDSNLLRLLKEARSLQIDEHTTNIVIKVMQAIVEERDLKSSDSLL